MTQISYTLRPGFLVVANTSLTGAVRYFREILEDDHVTSSGSRVAEWQTRRIIDDADEYTRGQKVREKARALIRGACNDSAFGLLCPEANVEKLNSAVRAAAELASEFNKTARLYRVNVSVLRGRVANDDEEAFKAIGSEIRELLDTVDTGIQNFDVKGIRAAADRAKGLASMLEPGAAKKVQDAIEAARAVARDIVAEKPLDETLVQRVSTITAARQVFIDLDEPQEVVPAARVAAPQLDLEV